MGARCLCLSSHEYHSLSNVLLVNGNASTATLAIVDVRPHTTVGETSSRFPDTLCLLTCCTSCFAHVLTRPPSCGDGADTTHMHEMHFNVLVLTPDTGGRGSGEPSGLDCSRLVPLTRRTSEQHALRDHPVRKVDHVQCIVTVR